MILASLCPESLPVWNAGGEGVTQSDSHTKSIVPTILRVYKCWCLMFPLKFSTWSQIKSGFYQKRNKVTLLPHCEIKSIKQCESDRFWKILKGFWKNQQTNFEADRWQRSRHWGHAPDKSPRAVWPLLFQKFPRCSPARRSHSPGCRSCSLPWTGSQWASGSDPKCSPDSVPPRKPVQHRSAHPPHPAGARNRFINNTLTVLVKQTCLYALKTFFLMTYCFVVT